MTSKKDNLNIKVDRQIEKNKTDKTKIEDKAKNNNVPKETSKIPLIGTLVISIAAISLSFYAINQQNNINNSLNITTLFYNVIL